MKLGDNLKRIRKENNLSQEQLAEKLGVSRQAVSKWESGQSYPEMDKVLTICKLFNYNIDELMNENVKEIDETKQAKNNINKYIDDFFAYITKTVKMLGSMKFKEKLKCFIEQVVIAIFLLFIFVIIGAIGSSILRGLISGLPSKIWNNVYNIFESVYLALALIIGLIIMLHIFKIRYLDYYEIIEEDESKNIEEKNVVNQINNKEKIIIRDPKDSQSKFLNGIARIVIWCIKFIVICIGIIFAFTFIGITTLLILSFLFVKTGLIFFGTFIGLISALIINFLILELFYNFIVSKKIKKNRMAWMFLASLILAGISIGIILIGITKFNYIDASDRINDVEDTFTVEMTDNLSIKNNSIQYIETESNDVKIVVKHSKYYKFKIKNYKERISIYALQEEGNTMEFIRDIINDINNKEITDYFSPVTYVYTSKENIAKILQN